MAAAGLYSNRCLLGVGPSWQTQDGCQSDRRRPKWCRAACFQRSQTGETGPQSAPAWERLYNPRSPILDVLRQLGGLPEEGFPAPLVKKGVVSGTGPAIRVDWGHVGGFITLDALQWLRDTGVIFHPTRLGWNPNASGPDRSALRRTQALVCSGAYRRRPWPSLARSGRPNSAAGCGRGAHRIGGCEHEDRQARCEGRA